jgi:hypothetical protein
MFRIRDDSLSPTAFLKNSKIRIFNTIKLFSVDAETLNELLMGSLVKAVVMLPADNIKSMKCASSLM